MIDQIREILDATAKTAEIIVEDGKILPAAAKVARAYYDELVKIGFTEDQAVALTANYKPCG
jgi:hypothetical protein